MIYKAITELIARIIKGILPRRWVPNSLWIRTNILRLAVLAASLYADGIILQNQTGRKISVINEFIKSILTDPDSRRYFTQDHRPESDEFAVPTPAFHDMLRDYLLCFNLQAEERYFKLDDLTAIARHLPAHGKKTGHLKELFRDRERYYAFFGHENGSEPVPESYLIHFFPSFDPKEFLRNETSFALGREKLFLPHEAERLVVFLCERMMLKDTSTHVQRMIPALKKLVIGAALLWYGSLFLFDLGMLVYGISKNEYFYTFAGLGRVIESFDSPYARRADRIFLRNHESKFFDFKSDGSPPSVWNNYRINNNAQVAVELNYGSYKALRVQDQNGLTAVSVDHDAIRDLAKSDRRRFNRLMDMVVNKRWWDTLLSFIDSASGHKLNLFDYTDIPEKRISASISGKIMESPAPLLWVRRVNKIFDCITVLYHKGNSLKWADIGEIPPVMIKAVILREDRRFGNDLFPVPHRGNDNLVIIPQIAKKLVRALLAYSHDFTARDGMTGLTETCGRLEERFKAAFRDEGRGGSSLSNQVMEMLYTKLIPTLSDKKSFAERQIVQKEHELPASLAVDWFWSEDNILEAYVNEVYGGHLYSDVRGFKSQAEMYFMKRLDDLNLRERIMLVAAIKKPSRIKEYAQWLKAVELKSLMEKKGVGPAALADWERDNAAYKVDRRSVAEIIASKESARAWIEMRLNGILRILYENGGISRDEYLDARHRQKVAFDFAPGVFSLTSRLINNIKREIDRELGPDRSDSGLVVVTTINMNMQRKLQAAIDRHSMHIRVAPRYGSHGGGCADSSCQRKSFERGAEGLK